MSHDDALGPDMHRLLGFLESTPPVASQDILDQLLERRLDADFAPAGYGELASLLAAATAPATPEELAGEQAALAVFRAVMPSHPPTLVPRRAPMPSKRLTVKAAAAALVAVLSIGGVAAAATGLLAGQAGRVADQAPSTTAASAAAQGPGKAAVTDLDNATQGSCRAWKSARAPTTAPGRTRRHSRPWPPRLAAPTTLLGTAPTSRPAAQATTVRSGRRRLGWMPRQRPGRGCAGPGRPARAPTTAAEPTRWHSRP